MDLSIFPRHQLFNLIANPPRHHASRSTQEAPDSIAKTPSSIEKASGSIEKASVPNLKASRCRQDLCYPHVLSFIRVLIVAATCPDPLQFLQFHRHYLSLVLALHPPEVSSDGQEAGMEMSLLSGEKL